MPNCAAKINKTMTVVVGDQVDGVYNGSNLRYSRPFERGYLNNWPCELDIWSRLFGPSNLNITPSEHSLVLTDAPFTPQSLQNETNEVVFEDFGMLIFNLIISN